MKDFSPLVSIIIPVYNGERYLKEAIDSALKQTYKNIEIIVINDGSNDTTEDVALAFGSKIRYFSKENGGTSTALNVGVKNMKGEYFSWLSHDDQYYPNKIEVQIDELRNLDDKSTVLIGDLDGIDENYKKIYETDFLGHANQYPSRLMSPIYPIIYMQLHGCTLLIPSIAFESVGIFDENCIVSQDYEFFYRLLQKFKYHYLPKIIVTARDHPTRQGNKRKILGSKEYSKLFVSIMESMSDEEMLHLSPNKVAFFQDMESLFRDCGYKDAEEYARKKLKKNLQVNYTDLIGNKFNGHDLHLHLIEQGWDSRQLVLLKDSFDKNTFLWTDNDYWKKLSPFIDQIEAKYDIRALSSPIPYDIVRSRLFLDADIIHYHIIHHPAFNFNLLPLMTRLKPSVWTLHDPWSITGRCIHPFECIRFESGCGNCPDISSPYPMKGDNTALNFAIKRDIIQRSTVTIVVGSNWLKNKVERSPITEGLPIHHIPFGVNQNFSSYEQERGQKKTWNTL